MNATFSDWSHCEICAAVGASSAAAAAAGMINSSLSSSARQFLSNRLYIECSYKSGSMLRCVINQTIVIDLYTRRAAEALLQTIRAGQ